MKIKKNWKLNDTVKPEDLNRIEGNIEALQAGLPEEDFTLEEKEKLASVEYGATAVSVENSLTSYSATAALSAKQGRKLKELIDERATKDKLDEQVGLAFKHTREVKAHLEGLINAEKTARESADSRFQTSINLEATARKEANEKIIKGGILNALMTGFSSTSDKGSINGDDTLHKALNKLKNGSPKVVTGSFTAGEEEVRIYLGFRPEYVEVRGGWYDDNLFLINSQGYGHEYTENSNIRATTNGFAVNIRYGGHIHRYMAIKS